MKRNPVIVRNLGQVSYLNAYDEMRRFTASRDESTTDELWVLEHQPVYTQGYSCTDTPSEQTDIPIIATDRGGQITYHGPGQLIVYLLLDMKRRRGVRHLVNSVLAAVRDVVESFGIESELRDDAPGVYVGGKKIASIGIRVSRGCSYHGISLNVNMDTEAFDLIDVCGIHGLEVTTLRRQGVTDSMEDVQDKCVESLCRHLNCEAVAPG